MINRGDGRDTILDYGSADKIVFGDGIVQGDLQFTRSGYNLVVSIKDPQNTAALDQLTIQNWFSSSSYQIEELVFADKQIISSSEVTTLMTAPSMTASEVMLIGVLGG